MVTLIIASDRKERFGYAQENFAATVGIDHQILLMSDLSRGLACAYNTGAQEAAFPFLCFVHDDVLFHTEAWGEKIIALLQDGRTGVVGVMGGRYKSYFGAGWRDGDAEGFRMNVKDGVEGGKLLRQNPFNKRQEEVICLDGALLCCSKAHWQQHPFDEKTFTGFHFYDLDICMQMLTAGLKNVVTFEVLIEHFSQGKKDRRFLHDFALFQKKWKDYLPLALETIPEKDICNFEGYALAETLQLMKENHFAVKESWRQLTAYCHRCKSAYHFLRSVYFGLLK